jgi:hypothetical protein
VGGSLGEREKKGATPWVSTWGRRAANPWASRGRDAAKKSGDVERKIGGEEKQ